MTAATHSEIPLIAPEIVTLIPYATARRLRALAVNATPTEVTVLLPDAANIEAVQELEGLTGRKVVPIESSSIEVLAWLDHLSGTINTNDLWLQQRHIAAFSRLVDHCLNIGDTHEVQSLVDRGLEFAPYSADLWLLKARVATQRTEVVDALTVAAQIAPHDRRVLRWIQSFQGPEADEPSQAGFSLVPPPSSLRAMNPSTSGLQGSEEIGRDEADAKTHSVADAAFHGARELSGVRDTGELVRRSALWLHTISAADSVSVYVKTEDDWIGWSTSPYLQSRLEQALPKANRLAAQVVRQGLPVVINETISRQEVVGSLIFETGVRSFAILPLRTENEVTGLAYLNFDQPDQANSIFGDAIGSGIELIVNTTANVAAAIEHRQEPISMTVIDPVTDTYTITQLERMMSAEVERARRYRFSVSVISFDIDDFASLNTLHGSKVGDKILREVSSLVRSLQRSSDILARRADDEFVLMLPQTTSHGAQMVADRLVRALADGVTVEGMHVSLRISHGLATFPDVADDSSALKIAAEMALYRAKAALQPLVSQTHDPTVPAPKTEGIS